MDGNRLPEFVYFDVKDQAEYEKSVWKNLDNGLLNDCVSFIRTNLTEEDKEWFTTEMNKHGKDWVEQNSFHFLGGGMCFRNWLRVNGFGEREFKIDNLDYIYVNLIEVAIVGKLIESDNEYTLLQKFMDKYRSDAPHYVDQCPCGTQRECPGTCIVKGEEE